MLCFFCQKVICRGLSCFLYLAIFIEVKCHRDTYLSPYRDARPLLRTREWFRSLDTDVNSEDGVWGRPLADSVFPATLPRDCCIVIQWILKMLVLTCVILQILYLHPPSVYNAWDFLMERYDFSIQVSCCKFWIYWVGVNTKFSCHVVNFVFTPNSKFQIYNMTQACIIGWFMFL